MSNETQLAKIGFIGLGVMGRSMAGHLLEAGYSLTVFNRSEAKAASLLQRGAHWAASPAQVAAVSEVIITMVGGPADVEEVYTGGNGILQGVRPGSLLIDCTTSSPALAVRIASLAVEKESEALDAPVTGGDIGAREARLSIMVGGSEGAFARSLPILGKLGTSVIRQGPAGSGQHAKMCNQLAIAGTMLGMCEALAYARKSGLEPHTVRQSICSGAAASWSLTHLAPRILAGDFAPGFSCKHFLKDLSIALATAEEMQLELPCLTLAQRLYRELVEGGYAEDGTQALIRWYERT